MTVFILVNLVDSSVFLNFLMMVENRILHCGREKFRKSIEGIKQVFIFENHFRIEDVIELSVKNGTQ